MTAFGSCKWRVYCKCGVWISEHRFWIMARFAAWLESDDYGHETRVARTVPRLPDGGPRWGVQDRV